MKDHYSFLAPYYNRLSKLVFGDQLVQAKTCFAEKLAEKSILIIGGGDGLDYQNFQNNLTGEYWEISQAMISRAKENLSESNLSFHLDFFLAKKEKLFDEVWLHFVLDTMSDEEICSLLEEIRKSLKPESRVYLVDFFAPKNSYQRFVSRSMIAFFRITTRHKRSSIPDYEEILRSQNLIKKSEKDFLRGWVKAQLWELH